MNLLGNIEYFTQWLAHTSWEAAWIVLAVLLARFCFRKSLPASWRYALWLLVVARLLLPGLPQMPLRTKGFAMDRGVTPVWAERWVASALETDAITPPAALPVTPTQPAQPAQAKPFSLSKQQGLALLWLLGATGFGAVALLQVRRFGQAVRRAPVCEDATVLACAQAAAEQMGIPQKVRQRIRILETPHVSAPAMMGLLRPVVLLPEGLPQRFSPEELRMVFLHEFAHLRRKDLWLNPLLLGLQIAHWFNPVLWFAFRQMRRDRELACDALVLEQDRIGLKRLYGETLLRLLEDFSPRQSAILPSVSMMESNRHLKERLTRIMQATTGASHAWRLGLALFLALGITTLTRNAITSKNTGEEPQPAPPDNPLFDPLPNVQLTINSQQPRRSPRSTSFLNAENRPIPPAQKNQERVRERFAKDRKTYTPEQFKELESLYQMANKELGSPGAKDVLKLVIEKYPQSNRAGCALMYLAQRSQGQERENYLKEAIEKYSDSFYGDGVQVGAYARFYLAGYYLESDKTDEAKTLQEQIRRDYPDAINHGGKPLMQESK